jgi:hypothetical protein
LTINKEFAQFDFDSISDVILHIRYTAREGTQPFADAAAAAVRGFIADGEAVGSVRLFSIRHDFPSEWARFRSAVPEPGRLHALSVELRPEHYPYWSRGRLNTVAGVGVLARSARDPLPPDLTIADHADRTDASAARDTLTAVAALGGIYVGPLRNIAVPASPTGRMTLFFDDNLFSELFIAVGWGG